MAERTDRAEMTTAARPEADAAASSRAEILPLEIIPTTLPDAQFALIRGLSRRLVLSFSSAGRLKRVPNTQPEFFGSAHADGENSVLFISDIRRSWMNREGWIEEVAARSREVARRIGATETIALGASMGAFSALTMACHMKLDRVLAIVPQYSVDPAVVPDEDRWMKYRDEIGRIRVRELDALPDEAEIFTLNGGTETELRHALRLPKPARTTHFVFPGYGHSLAQRLARRRALQPIVRAFVNGDTAEATRRIRAEGGITRQRHVRLARRARRAATLREA
ncbi:MAG: hypothetical protein KDK10_04390 [Maritimibacter sp.]|nr:hypothetical protein [Maritimibacter sp.]